jgi:acetyltransferase-like isoleucine patch superfamily enzyme
MVRKYFSKLLGFLVPELKPILSKRVSIKSFQNIKNNSEFGKLTNIVPPFKIFESSIGDGTYISSNSQISKTQIGKFCSIGPNLISGWGMHPTDGLSTSPYFYSTAKQNGSTLALKNLYDERKPIVIGNDVFIGANVTILDGIRIGDGAVVGAGSVVSKDIPDFAIAYGNPISIKRMRFTEKQQNELKKIAWWNFDDNAMKDVNTYFFEVEKFISKHRKS